MDNKAYTTTELDENEKKLYRIYNELEIKYSPKLVNASRFSTPVNFKEAMLCPIHRWYSYREGFSPLFVKNFIEKYKTKENCTVFDPFGGIGTTVLESSIMGIKAYSTDVNPLGNFAAKVKTESYTDNDLKKIEYIKKELAKTTNYEEYSKVNNDTVNSYFFSETLSSLLKLKAFIFDIQDEKIKNFFLLAFITLLDTVSTHKKDGNGLKRKKKLPKPLSFEEIKNLLFEKLDIFIKDVNVVKPLIKPTIIDASCIDKYEIEQNIDIVITSPPYANCFDYSKVYINELWFGGFFKEKSDQKRFREKSVSSHVHFKWAERNTEYKCAIVSEVIIKLLREKKLWDNKIPNMINGYFSDLGKCLSNLKKVLSNHAIVGVVVGNSCYSGVIIPTDIILANIAENLGYSVKKIEIYRYLTASSQQMKLLSENKKCFLRESLVVLEWKE